MQNTLVIENPSNRLLEVVRKMRDTKEQNKKDILSKKDMYFSKK